VEEVLSEAKVLRRTFFFKEGEASVAFPSLKKNIYMELSYIRRDAREPQHLGLYAIIPVLVYACETWTVTKTLKKASQYIRNLLFAENLTCPVPYVYQAHYK